MKAQVDEELCTGCGPCEEICPEVFKIEDGVSRVQADPVPTDIEDSCREAMEQCPADAISIEE
ncbi:MAG: ferredoxin [Sedimentisphaerales bacterium]